MNKYGGGGGDYAFVVTCGGDKLPVWLPRAGIVDMPGETK